MTTIFNREDAHDPRQEFFDFNFKALLSITMETFG